MTSFDRLARFCGLAALAASTAMVLFVLCTPVRAGDKGALGGACCADLEERVAELEATASRKGNRKVTVTIYGQVHKSMLWTDLDGLDSKKGHMLDPAHDPSLVGFRGEAKISPNWKAGYVLELQIANPGAEGIDTGKALFALPATPDGKNELQLGEQGTAIRHSALWIEGPMGKFTLGHTSMATDGVTEINLSNSGVAVRPLSLSPVKFGGAAAGLNIPFDGYRANVARYDSPAMAGFVLSGSLAEDDSYDAAVRFAGEAGGFRFAAGAGFRKAMQQTLLNGVNVFDVLAVDVLGAHKAYSASASLKHINSGLFANAFYSRIDYELAYSVSFLGFPAFGGALPDLRLTGYGAQGGIEKNWFGVGATTLYGEYQRFDGNFAGSSLGAHPSIYGVGLVQTFDAAALDIYVALRQLDPDLGSGVDKINSGSIGMRIKF